MMWRCCFVHCCSVLYILAAEFVLLVVAIPRFFSLLIDGHMQEASQEGNSNKRCRPR